MTSSQKILLYASEIGSITGDNIYRPVENTLIDVWKRNFGPSYSMAKMRTGYLEDEEKAIKYMKKYELYEEFKNLCVDKKQQATEKSKKFKVLLDTVKCEDSENEIIKDYANSTFNKNFGIYHEKEAIDKTKGAATTKEGFYEDFVTCGFHWRIYGKIDALKSKDSEEKKESKEITRVVEIKHRIGKLKDSPPDYDIVQCKVYLKLTKAKVCELIEVLKTSDEEERRVTEFSLTDEEWKGIFEKCEHFIQCLMILENDIDIQDKYLTGNFYDRQNVLEVIRSHFRKKKSEKS